MPARARDRSGAELLELTVLDPDGTPHTLADLLGGKPGVLVFLRHFG